MRFDVSTAKADNLETPVALVAVFEGAAEDAEEKKAAGKQHGEKGIAATQLGKAGLDIDALLSNGDITGKAGELLLVTHTGELPCARVLLVGCGKRAEFDRAALRAALSSAFGWLCRRPYQAAACLLTHEKVRGADAFRSARIVAEVWHHNAYRFTELKSTNAEPECAVAAITVGVRDAKGARAARKGVGQGDALGQGMNFSRRLANLPGNVCTPTYLAETAKQLARGTRNLKCKVLSESDMKKLGMGSLLSVSAGSVEPAKLIVLEYSGAARSQKPTVLVGKGVTFDTGGISLKPPATMDEMKFDMSGAASVFGTFKALAELQPKLNAVGIIPTVENMPGGAATKPGDIVTSMSGQTIEILNTDAEGRLILCDALTYAQKNYEPAALIDIATLTGACVIALGSHHAGLMSNSDSLANRLLAAGLKADDRAWRLPLGEDYAKQLSSNFADMANIGGREAGTITAGCFLGKFIDDTDWAHLDIAGTAYQGGEKKGSSGRPVPLLLEYILNA